MSKQLNKDCLVLAIANTTRPAAQITQQEETFLTSPYGVMFSTFVALCVGCVIGALI